MLQWYPGTGICIPLLVEVLNLVQYPGAIVKIFVRLPQRDHKHTKFSTGNNGCPTKFSTYPTTATTKFSTTVQLLYG